MVKVTRNKTQVVQYLRENQRNVRGPEESRRIRPVQPFVGCPGSALGIPRKWRNLLGRSGTSWRSSGFLPNEGSRKSNLHQVLVRPIDTGRRLSGVYRLLCQCAAFFPRASCTSSPRLLCLASLQWYPHHRTVIYLLKTFYASGPTSCPRKSCEL